MEYVLLALSLVSQIKAALKAPAGTTDAAVAIPEIRTYINGTHIALNLTVAKLP